MIVPILFFVISSTLCVTVAKHLRFHHSYVYDPLHICLPYIDFKYFSDVLIFIQLFLFFINLTNQIIIEFMIIMGCIQFMRALTICSTVLPPLKHFNGKIRLGGINGIGTEYIFSGHASYACLSAIYLASQGVCHWFPLLVYNILSQLMVIVSHNHYTVDVVLAWIITPLLYSNLKLCQEVDFCKEKITQTVLTKF